MTTHRDDLIDWLRHTTPERVVDETVDKLQAGVSIDDLYAAGALTAARHVSTIGLERVHGFSQAIECHKNLQHIAVGFP